MAIRFKHEAKTDEEFYYELCSYLMINQYLKGSISCESKSVLDGLRDYMISLNIPCYYADCDDKKSVGYKLIDDSDPDAEDEEDVNRDIIIDLENGTILRAEPKKIKTTFEKLEFEAFDQPMHLQNVEIRKMFLKTFQYAENEIDIISPWMNHAVINEEFMNRMKFALDRGVIIKIKYGLNPGNSEYSVSSSTRSDNVANKLKKKFERYLDTKFFITRDNIHYKLVLCDEKYKLEGSYNYLSFTGDYQNDTRTEGSPFGMNVEEIRLLRSKYFGDE